LYRALGGGWELREGQDFASPETQAQMRERTRWGDMLTMEEEQSEIDAAASGTETDRGWWRWRWWWPLW
jgi:hypothetical protein